MDGTNHDLARRTLRRARWVIGGLLLALVGAEFGLRAAGRTPRLASVGHERYGYVLLPDQVHAEGGFVRRINAQGFHGDDWPEPEPSTPIPVREGGDRGLLVCVLDSSHGVGEGVDPADAWPRVLERMLSAERPPGETLVLNASVGGWGLEQHGAYYFDHLAERRPEVVVLGVSAVSGIPNVVRGTPRSPLRRLLGRSVLFDLWQQHVAGDRGTGFAPVRSAAEEGRRRALDRYLADPLDEAQDPLWEAAGAVARAIAGRQAEHGGRVLLVAAPSRGTGGAPSGAVSDSAPDASARSPLARARAFGAGPVLDPSVRPPFSTPEGGFLAADPEHWTPEGHRAVAEAVRAAIEGP